MNKSTAIQIVNDHLGKRALTRANITYAKYPQPDKKQVWWHTIAPQKFKNELHLLLAKKPGLIWLRIEADAIPNPADVFAPRTDSKMFGKLSLEICSDASSPRYMRDIRSGGTGYDFRPHIAHEWYADPIDAPQDAATKISAADALQPSSTQTSATHSPQPSPTQTSVQSNAAAHAHTAATGDNAASAPKPVDAAKTAAANPHMPKGRHKIAQGQVTVISSAKTTVFNPGDTIPPLIELHEAAASLLGGPVFDGTDVLIEYMFYYVDEIHNLHAFLSDYPQVSMEQALAAIKERVYTNDVVHSNRGIVSGSPIFKGTRVPIDILFEYLASGENIAEFVECFPTVTREQAKDALMLALHALETVAYETSSR